MTQMRRLNVQQTQIEECIRLSMFAVDMLPVNPPLQRGEELLLQLVKADAVKLGLESKRVQFALIFDHVRPDPTGEISRQHWPLVPWGEGSEIIRDSLACLRRITCEDGTPRVLPGDLAQGAYSAWERARRDIFDEWQKAADPRNLQPDIRPLFKAAAAHVRRHIPADMSREEADRVVDALEAPWGLRVEKALRSVFTPETAAGEATTRKIAEQVKILGLQPWKAPEPLPPIEQEDVVLVVWMGVESEGTPRRV